MEFHHIVPQDGDMDGETEANEDHHPTPADPPIWADVLILYAFTIVRDLCFHVLFIDQMPI